MQLKKVLRWCPPEQKLRLFRLLWKNEKLGKIGTKNGGHSSKLSLAIRPVLYRWQTEFRSYRLILCGIDIHYKQDYGGVME